MESDGKMHPGVIKAPRETVLSVSSLTAKVAYSRDAQRKLLTIRRKLRSVDAKLSNAQATGLLEQATQLETAHRSIKKHMTRVERRLEALRKSGASDWQRHRESVECAWEDLYRSIRHMLAHLPHEIDETRQQ